MLDGGTNCGKEGTTMAAVHGPGAISGAMFGPAGPLSARTTYGVTSYVFTKNSQMNFIGAIFRPPHVTQSS